MIRPVAVILAALNSVAPSFPHKEAAAPLVQRLADDGGFDPFTLIEYVDSESGWEPEAIGNYLGAGEVVGLGQHRLLNFEPCQVDFGSVACDLIRHALLEWRFNLEQTARVFIWSRERCKEIVGSGAFTGWMQVVKGYDKVNGTTCGRRRVGNRWVKAKVPVKVIELQKRIALLAKGAE